MNESLESVRVAKPQLGYAPVPHAFPSCRWSRPILFGGPLAGPRRPERRRFRSIEHPMPRGDHAHFSRVSRSCDRESANSRDSMDCRISLGSVVIRSQTRFPPKSALALARACPAGESCPPSRIGLCRVSSAFPSLFGRYCAIRSRDRSGLRGERCVLYPDRSEFAGTRRTSPTQPISAKSAP